MFCAVFFCWNRLCEDEYPCGDNKDNHHVYTVSDRLFVLIKQMTGHSITPKLDMFVWPTGHTKASKAVDYKLEARRKDNLLFFNLSPEN